MKTGNNIVLYDGECIFCSAAIRFILRHNTQKNLYFAALQSPVAKEFLTHFHFEDENMNTLIFIQKQQLFIKSTAVLRITKYLNAGYPLLMAGLIIPKIFRDFIYDFIAKRRHLFFKNNTDCALISPIDRDRFLG